ncbi:MAG: PIG-L deacetylase family protein [Verrucomicrobiota bacterium]
MRRAMRKVLRPLRRFERGAPRWPAIEELSKTAPFGAWARQRVLVIFAHPDDEAFCSGLVATLVEAKAEVRFLCMTRGEGGEAAGMDQEEIGAVRERELQDAAEILGVTAVSYLGYVDPAAARSKPLAPVHDVNELTVRIRQAVLAYGATVVVTHGSGGEYWHPAHVCLHDCVKRVAASTPAALLTMNAWNPEHPLAGILNQDDLPSYRVDGGAVFQQRLRALEAHGTQRGVFERFCGGTVADFVRATEHESYRLVT